MIIVNKRVEFLLSIRELLPYNCFGAEIGVLNGDFSQNILEVIQPKQLFLVDPFIENGIKYKSGLSTAYSTATDLINLKKRFEKEIIKGQAIILREFSHRIVNDLKNGFLDFIYQDASHLYADLKRDLNDWVPKLKNDGIMCGHDYIEHEDFGVIQAVDEFCLEHNFEMIIFNENGGDYALKKI